MDGGCGRKRGEGGGNGRESSATVLLALAGGPGRYGHGVTGL
jgi:hypothetical protein